MNCEPIYERPKAIKSIIQKFHLLCTRSEEKFNTDNLCVIYDIETAIHNIKITDKQNQALVLFMEGYTYQEIGMKMNISKQTASEHIDSVCSKVCRYLVDNNSLV